MTPAPLQLGQAPSELALNSAGFTPLAFANALRIGSSSPVYVAGLLRREPRIAPWSIDTTSAPAGIDPCTSELLPEPATYTGLLDPIRKAFAKANGVKPALFSANSEGACPNCNGAGVIYTDLAMMAGVATTCEECEGKRFEASVLDHHLGGRDISEVLAMSVTEAEEFFGAGEARTPAAHAILDRLADVGLGYLSLGQPLTTLSGGERQRLKLATHMSEKGGVYVLDEPTTGLHLADVEQLLGLLDRLVDSGK